MFEASSVLEGKARLLRQQGKLKSSDRTSLGTSDKH